MDDFNDIALFVQVVRLGSFAAVGRHLRMPPNTVSRRIQDLEGRLGVRLMQRSTRKLSLTGAGRAFHERCAAAVGDLERASRDLIDGSQQPAGRVRVATVADFFDFYPLARIKAFLEAYPKVQVEFVLGDQFVDLLAEGIDVALRGPSPRGGGHAVHLITVPAVGLLASPAYLAERGVPRTLKDLERHDCLTAARPDGRAAWHLSDRGGRSFDVEVSGRFSVNSARALHQATVAGLGIALLPNSPMAAADIAAGRLATVLPEYQRAEAKLHAVYPSRDHIPSAVSALVRSMTEWLKQEFGPAGRCNTTGG